MSPVPSHICFLFEQATHNTGLLIDSRWPASSLQATHAISQTDLALVHLLIQRFLIFYCHVTHLLARCDRLEDPSARTTRRYL